MIVCTGRMVQSARRVLAPARWREPLVCYQGAAVVDADDRWLLHAPLDLELAREVIEAVEEEGYSPNVYVDDELYVGAVTPEARQYSDFQQIVLHPVGDLLAWLERPPTKLVCVGEPSELDGVEARMRERFGGRLHISKSLPFFLEFAATGISKSSALEFLANRLGFERDRTVTLGDAENDLDLVEWGYGVAVDNADPRVKKRARWVCPPADDEGVAQVLEARLEDSAL